MNSYDCFADTLWIAAGVVVAASTTVLLFGGVRQLVDSPAVAVEPAQRRALAT